MNQREKATLVSCRTFLVDNLHNISSLLDDFIEAGLVNSDQTEEISTKPTRLAQVQAFLNAVPHWGPVAFPVFLKSLERNGCAHILKKLKEVRANVLTENILSLQQQAPPWLSQHVGRIPATERLLHLLAQELAPDQLFTMGSLLGHSHCRLQHIQASNPYMPSVQLSTMLCDWKNAHGNHATLECLVSALMKSGIREDVYRSLILDDIGVGGQQNDVLNRMDTFAGSESGNTEQWV